MLDQSFNKKTINSELRKSDFLTAPRLRDKTVKAGEIGSAVGKANTSWDVSSALLSGVVKGKLIYRACSFSDELLLRKLNRNLREHARVSAESRDAIIANIAELVREGVEYRIYRLDIKGFYESISSDYACALIDKLVLLSQPTKRHIKSILDLNLSLGGTGVPRGFALSATIAEIVMKDFDRAIKSIDGVFFYARYVDDIIILTDRTELPYRFIKKVKQSLPSGMYLNRKKQIICETNGDVTPHKSTAEPVVEVDFEYLGYRFIVSSPLQNNKKRAGQHFRDVRLDIAESKVKKTKTRLCRALMSFNQNRDFSLLVSRIKFLASNFSVIDADRDRKRLAGIFYNYHRVDAARSVSLQKLDSYLVKIVSSGHGKISDEFYSKTTLSQRRELLSISFRRGFSTKIFLHFSHSRLKAIQECWKYV
ncbi:antiviral reverse transcriptase Drt3a [Pseudomonas aeruginosa]|uniref:antiviral reverse transcriptase Drt3a n=1 Tax=Pseudomonas aeruginosa TaxID=287 RepID=UPI0009A23BEE|nr:antiviral reverse transcriptase Drt3a [Pseudomonas aeruginosa]MBG4584770.1 RNA-directed DNA polymerase [Pseudomonas aeruginosa]MBG5862625.1 RNA-directed DNA polymerase [Pseudomonas aeruginosa]MBG6294204.1 RNA-directed DNA polymerase [Pseudomonas aeruginosa]MBG7141097.1 RNA-directed DNA polymerase [Pseudomonas aeruginosa]MBG7257016.1 RNA-directed DNA polymerase [Pseudomonas aeruginosa]